MAPDFDPTVTEIKRKASQLVPNATVDSNPTAAFVVESLRDILVSELTRAYTLGLLHAHRDKDDYDY